MGVLWIIDYRWNRCGYKRPALRRERPRLAGSRFGADLRSRTLKLLCDLPAFLSCYALVQNMPVSLLLRAPSTSCPVRLCGACSLLSLSLTHPTQYHTLKLAARHSTPYTFLAYQLSLCDILSTSRPPTCCIPTFALPYPALLLRPMLAPR